MYEPVRIRRRPSRRRKRVTLVMAVAVLIAIVVTVVRTMPHPEPTEPLTLDEVQMLIPDAAQTEIVAAMVRSRIAQANATPGASAAATASNTCVAARTRHKWDRTQRKNAKTIVQVGDALDVSERGEVIALATAMQESRLYNLGHLGAKNDHDSLGLFQQRPSMGWGSPRQVRDPVFAATAFYLALQRVPRWEKLAVTVAAQKVQRSAFPNAYAKWEADARALVQEIHCNAL